MTLSVDDAIHVRNKLNQLRDDKALLEIQLGKANSEILLLRLACSLLLVIAERSTSEYDKRKCATVKQMLGQLPDMQSTGLFRPELVVDNTKTITGAVVALRDAETLLRGEPC